MNEFTDIELGVMQEAVFRQSHDNREAMRLPLVDVKHLEQSAVMLESIGCRIREERLNRLGVRR